MYRLLLVLPLLLIGCGTSSKPDASDPPTTSMNSDDQPVVTATSPSAVKPTVNNRPDVPSDAFSSVAEAISALTIATEAKTDEDRYRATEWLVNQGDAAVAPLAAELEDPRTGTRSQITVTRIIGRIGTVEAAAVLTKIANAENQMAAINAIQLLGQVTPSADTVDALIKLLDHDDDRRRLESVKALGEIGEPASAAGEKLIALQNSRDNDALRRAARKSLEQVDPRRTLVD